MPTSPGTDLRRVVEPSATLLDGQREVRMPFGVVSDRGRAHPESRGDLLGGQQPVPLGPALLGDTCVRLVDASSQPWPLTRGLQCAALALVGALHHGQGGVVGHTKGRVGVLHLPHTSHSCITSLCHCEPLRFTIADLRTVCYRVKEAREDPRPDRPDHSPAPHAAPHPRGSAALGGPTRPASKARLHKRRVRAHATARVAQLALLFLVTPTTPPAPRPSTPPSPRPGAWPKTELAHQHFVRTQPATVADL